MWSVLAVVTCFLVLWWLIDTDDGSGPPALSA